MTEMPYTIVLVPDPEYPKHVNPLEAAQLAIDELRDENTKFSMRIGDLVDAMDASEAEGAMLRHDNAEMMRAFEKLYWVADNAGEVLDIVSDMLARR